MRKVFYHIGLLLLFTSNLFAQPASRVTIKGIICDSAGIAIPSAMIMLLNAKDSTLFNFTQADDKGEFVFRNIKNSGYLLKISHMSYLPYQKFFNESATNIADLGKISLKLISKQLMEVVIKAARAPLKFRGDTIEYDASSFKVSPGSTVEDLLRRLPGIDIDVDGNIKTQGKDVKRVYVEGKTFFGDDPKSVTKNLGAETVSKVQVFDEKSEQSKLTGISDGIKEKAMNLGLKEEYKKGAFGKLTAAIGDQNRWASRGSYNRFNKTQQLSFIGFGNNVNQTGVNWEDYGEFRGQNSFDNYDNGDFGFSSSGFMILTIRNNMLGNDFDGRGLTNNYGAGVNYNFDNKKTKINSSYVYNETTRALYQTSNKETFLQNSIYKNADTTYGRDFRGNHSIGIRLEKDIDSTNILIAKANIKVSKSTDNNTIFSLYSDTNNNPSRTLKTITGNYLDAWNITSAAIFRHHFKKKGSSFALSGGFNTSKSDGLDSPYSINRFFQANTFTEQMRLLSSDNNNKTTQFKSSMLITQPLSKLFFWEAFYNFRYTRNIQDRLTENAALQNIRVDSLSAYYTNEVLYNRIGSSFRYSNKGVNATAGVAVLQLQLKGNYAIQRELLDPQSSILKTYSNLVPNLDVGYQLFKTTYLSVGYNFDVKEPTVSQLMPITNVNNLAYKIEGNPDLQPQLSHNFSLNTTYWNQASMSSIFMTLTYHNYINQIVYNQTITTINNIGIQAVSRPDNVKGGDNISFFTGINFPLIKTKLTMSLNSNITYSNSPTYINDIENITKNKGYDISTFFNLNANQKLVLGINWRINFNDITYSFRSEQNQHIRNYSTNATAKWQFALKSYFESNFNYSVFRNKKLGFNQDIPMLNASIRQIVGKNNRIEIRLAAFDIFNRNQSISQSGAENYILRSSANTLARYFMLSLSYNLKGFDIKLK